MKVKVLFTTKEEQERLYSFLSEKGYHWLSGQPAANPPAFFRNPFRKSECIKCVRTVETKTKTIGWMPTETLKEEELEKLEADCLSVDGLIRDWDFLMKEAS